MATKVEIEIALENIIKSFDTFRQYATEFGFVPHQHPTWTAVEDSIKEAREL